MDSAGPWVRGGLHTGDRLVSVGGRAISSTRDFRASLGQLKIGDVAQFQIERDGTKVRVEVPVVSDYRANVTIGEIESATPEQLKLRAQWIDGK